MCKILSTEECRDQESAGNKAARLALLADAGFNVPPFCVLVDAADSQAAAIETNETELLAAIRQICPGNQRFAVRSSSREEDGASMSFAGQFDTFLNIETEAVLEHATRVFASASNDRSKAYRRSRGAMDSCVVPAVLVQQMIDADSAGVAFAADPVSGDANVAVVAAVAGTGETLVSGDGQGDTWRVDARGRIASCELEGKRPVLAARQVRQIAELARQVSACFDVPQDIEWAYSGTELYLLQSRDITTLGQTSSVEAYALWDNSNIVESYGGVTTPLTFSVARSAYQEAYRHMGRALGVSERIITENRRCYEQMIGLIQGRVYYNLLNWYRLLMLTPGFRFNHRFMEQMMGVTEGLPAESIPVPQTNRRFAALRAAVGLARVSQRLTTRLVVHNSRVSRFHRKLDALLQPVDLQAKSLTQLIDYYESLQESVIPAWDTPLINDLYCMIFHGALRQLCVRWLDDGLTDIHNDLVSGESGIISVEPVRRMKSLAALAARDKVFAALLCTESVTCIEKNRARQPQFFREYDDYLERFGDRCLDELKLESETLGDDPLLLLRGIGQLACSGKFSGDECSSDLLRQNAEATVAPFFRRRPVRGQVFRLVLRLARARVRDRENLRFERTRVYGRVRSVFLEIGCRLASLGVIADARDIFYLNVDEISAFIRGIGSSCEYLDLVRCRKQEFATYAASDGPPRRFVTSGPPQLDSSMQTLPA
ncbi:MAG: PEP/pyruvate-binding domain-containing protein, partial [Woeseiaceae bacterium]